MFAIATAAIAAPAVAGTAKDGGYGEDGCGEESESREECAAHPPVVRCHIPHAPRTQHVPHMPPPALRPPSTATVDDVIRPRQSTPAALHERPAARRVSVVVPVRNARASIHSALASVAA